MSKAGFIFDLDGVIVDTAKYHYLAWKNLADELDITFTKEDNERFKGVSRRRCLEILLNMGGVTVSKEQFETWLTEKNEDYLRYIDKMDENEILPDVQKTLSFLKENNIPMALGSASKNAIPILKKVSLLHYFDAVVDGNSVTKAKPDPEVFLIAAEKLGLSPKNCVVYEDAVAGIQAANSANMLSIGIGSENILSEATYNFKDFTYMDLEFIDKLVRSLKDRN